MDHTPPPGTANLELSITPARAARQLPVKRRVRGATHGRRPPSYELRLRLTRPGDSADPRAGPFSITIDHEGLLASADADRYGAALSAMVFTAEAAAAFAAMRAAVVGGGETLRLRLDLPPELHIVRWETLRDPERGTALACDGDLLVSRYLSGGDYRRIAPRPRAQVRALLAIAAPTDLGVYRLAPIVATAEAQRVSQALAGVTITHLRASSAERATLDALHDALTGTPYDILYLVAHGALDDGLPVLFLEDAQGKVERVAGERLVTLIAGLHERRPRLVVLASCESAGDGYAATLAALGPALARAGVPAVLAMQGQFTMATNARFAPALFRELLAHGAIDRAVNAARLLVADQPDWWMPVLYSQLQEGLLWEKPAASAPQGPRSFYDEERRLDAAIPAQSTVNELIRLLVHLHRVDTPGLRAILSVAGAPGPRQEDIQTRAVRVIFPSDTASREPLPAPVQISVEVDPRYLHVNGPEVTLLLWPGRDDDYKVVTLKPLRPSKDAQPIIVRLYGPVPELPGAFAAPPRGGLANIATIELATLILPESQAPPWWRRLWAMGWASIATSREPATAMEPTPPIYRSPSDDGRQTVESPSIAPATKSIGDDLARRLERRRTQREACLARLFAYRSDLDDATATALAEELDDLPEAVELAGSLLRHRHDRPPADYLAALRSPQLGQLFQRIGPFPSSASAEPALIKAVLLCYQQLHAEADLAVRLLERAAHLASAGPFSRAILIEALEAPPPDEAEQQAIAAALALLATLQLLDQRDAERLRIDPPIASCVRRVADPAAAAAAHRATLAEERRQARRQQIRLRTQSRLILQRWRPAIQRRIANAIAAELADAPEALRLAGGTLAALPGLRSGAYLTALRKLDPIDPEERAFRLAYARLGIGQDGASLRRRLLARAALLAPGHPAPRSLLVAAAGLPEHDAPKEAYEPALAQLTQLGLITGEGDRTATMPPRIAGYIRQLDADPAAQSAVTQAVLDASKQLRRAGQGATPAFLTVLRSVTDAVIAADDMAVAGLCAQLDLWLSEARDYRAAERYAARALAIQELLLGEAHRFTLNAMANLAQDLVYTGKVTEARALYERLLALRRQTLGPNDPATLSVQARLKDLG